MDSFFFQERSIHTGDVRHNVLNEHIGVPEQHSILWREVFVNFSKICQVQNLRRHFEKFYGRKKFYRRPHQTTCAMCKVVNITGLLLNPFSPSRVPQCVTVQGMPSHNRRHCHLPNQNCQFFFTLLSFFFFPFAILSCRYSKHQCSPANGLNGFWSRLN